MSSTETTTVMTTLRLPANIDDNVDYGIIQEMNDLTNITNAPGNESLSQFYNRSLDATTTQIVDLDPFQHNDITNITVLCIKSFIFGSIIIGAVLGNALVILAVRRNRKLR
jgi:hypothetical protein